MFHCEGQSQQILKGGARQVSWKDGGDQPSEKQQKEADPGLDRKQSLRGKVRKLPSAFRAAQRHLSLGCASVLGGMHRSQVTGVSGPSRGGGVSEDE